MLIFITLVNNNDKYLRQMLGIGLKVIMVSNFAGKISKSVSF